MKKKFFYFILAITGVTAESSASFVNRTHKIFRRRVTESILLTDNQKKLIVDKHNELRKIVNPPAADMLEMSWDDDLEKLATTYTRKCLYEHNKDRHLEGFRYIGENLYISTGVQITDQYGADAVISWDAEKEDYDYRTRTCQRGKACGHYTQTAWAKSYKVGCGMTKCDVIAVNGEQWQEATIFACNYAPGGNYVGQDIYTEGIPCFKCPEGYWCNDRLCANSAYDSGTHRKMLMAFLSVVHFVAFLFVQ